MRIRTNVIVPAYRWGSVSRNSIGMVKEILENGTDCIVNFPEHPVWTGRLEELELVTGIHCTIE